MQDQDAGAWWIFFGDHGPDAMARVGVFAESLGTGSLSRRIDAGIVGGADTLDLEPWEGYVGAVEAALGRSGTRTASRYLNAVSVNASAREAAALLELPFVTEIRPVAGGVLVPPVLHPVPSNDMSVGQLEQVGVLTLIERGWTGSGVTVGIMDTGFNLSHASFDGMDIMASYDFLMDDPEVGWQPGDPAAQAAHGTAVLSVLGGYQPGVYSGAARGASFLLAKTEDTSGEYPAEEDFWVEGLEWLDLQGAELVSSSLGYIDWYTWEDMDGNTAVTTIAADMAASRGMPVVNAIGNFGPGEGTLIAPSDGDSVFAVGGVDALGNPASFSSWGPTWDGRIKPEVCARAVFVILAQDAETGYAGGDGTSFATPMVAGAAALLLEAHPEWSTADALEAIRLSASTASEPGPVLGWGVMDAASACMYRSVSGCVRSSASGDLLPGYPLSLSIGSSKHDFESGPGGWFAYCPGVYGNFTLTGTGSGNPLPVQGTLGESGVEVTVYVDGESSGLPPTAFPVPSTGGVWFGFDLASQADVSVTILDLGGTRVAGVSRTSLPAGSYRAPVDGEALWWDGCQEDGRPVASGVYFALVDTGAGVAILKLALVR